MYLMSSALLTYGIVGGIVPVVLKFATLVAVAWIVGKQTRFVSWKDVMPYSASWAVIVALLDALIWVPFAGWTLYASWGVWLGYFLVLAVPPIALRFSARTQV